MFNPVSISFGQQIAVLRMTIPRLQGFAGVANRICQSDYNNFPTRAIRICCLDWTFLARNCGRFHLIEKLQTEAKSANHSLLIRNKFILMCLWWWVGWLEWGGFHSHFHVQPNYSIEIVLCCRWGCDNSLLFYQSFFWITFF